MSALRLMGLAFDVLCCKAHTSHLISPGPHHSPQPLQSPLLPRPSARDNFTAGKKQWGHHGSPNSPLSPTQAPLCPTGGWCPSCLPRAGHGSVSQRQEAKVPSVSLEQMLHREKSESLQGKGGGRQGDDN